MRHTFLTLQRIREIRNKNEVTLFISFDDVYLGENMIKLLCDFFLFLILESCNNAIEI